MPSTHDLPLTPHGEHLYRLLTQQSPCEWTIREFIDQVLMGEPQIGNQAACLACTERRALIANAYCLACTSQSLKRPPTTP